LGNASNPSKRWVFVFIASSDVLWSPLSSGGVFGGISILGWG